MGSSEVDILKDNKTSVFDRLNKPFNEIMAESMKNFQPIEEERIADGQVIFLDEDANESEIERFLNNDYNKRCKDVE